MRTFEILAKAADKLETGWTTGTSARSSEGVAVSYASPNACSWCSAGAIAAAAGPDGEGVSEAIDAYRDHLYQRFGALSISSWNDHRCPDQATAVTTMRAAAWSVRAEAGR